MSKQVKSETSLKEFISFEEDLLNTIIEKCKNNKSQQQIESLKFSSIQKIKKLYKKATEFFKNLEFFMDFYKFLLKHQQNEGLDLIQKMMNFFPMEETVYKMASEEFMRKNDVKGAKEKLKVGIEKLKHCPGMYEKYFALILQELNETNQEPLLAEATIVLEQAAKYDLEVDLFVKLSDEVQKLVTADRFQLKILAIMLDKYGKKEITYDTLAQRYLDGFHYKPDESISPTTIENHSFRCDSETKNLQYCKEVLVMACNQLTTEKMYYLYINKMAYINDKPKTLTRLKRKYLGTALSQCHEARKMSEDHYIMYIKLLKEDLREKEKMLESSEADQKHLLQVMDFAKLKYPSSSKIWIENLLFFIHKDDHAKVEEIFNEAINNLKGENALAMWNLMYSYELSRNLEKSHHMIHFFHKAIQQGDKFIGNYYKPHLLSYICGTDGIDKARFMYEELQNNAKPCLDLHYKMAEMESIIAKPDVEKIRKCYENAINQFGKEVPEVSPERF